MQIVTRVFRYTKAHKVGAFLFLLLLLGGGYLAYTTLVPEEATVRYVTEAARRGTLTVSIGGTGQVSSQNQIELKPKASGTITSLAVVNGQEVKAGAVLGQVDASDALKTVRDAEVNLKSAELALTKLRQPADASSVAQTENALKSAEDNVAKLALSQAADHEDAVSAEQKAEDNIVKAYEDALNAVSNAFLDLSGAITTLDDVLHSQGLADVEPTLNDSSNASNFINTIQRAEDRDIVQRLLTQAESDYTKARQAYDQNLLSYKATSRFSDASVIGALLLESLETTKLSTEAAKSEISLLDAWLDVRADQHDTTNQKAAAQVNTYRTDLLAVSADMNGHVSSLLTVERTRKESEESLTTAQRDLKNLEKNGPLDKAAAEQSVKEKEAALADLKKGPDALDVQSQELTIQQRHNALNDARSELADYTFRSPLDGVVASVAVKRGDEVSSGTTIATIITKQKIAEVSLNEVDVAKVKLEQKTTLTFDAIEDLTITGTVVEIGALGEVTQGVVSYVAKIGFDTQDERVKSGMSVTAAIITEVKTDVLLVPASAVKSDTASYVEVLVNNEPVRRAVEVGLTNDTSTEISGEVKEGDEVVTQTITSSATTTSSTRSGGGLPIGGRGN